MAIVKVPWLSLKNCCELTRVCVGFLRNKEAFSVRAKDQPCWDYSDNTGAQTCWTKLL